MVGSLLFYFFFIFNGGFYVVKVVHCADQLRAYSFFCITDLSLELFSNVRKAGFLIMGLFKVGGGGVY